MYAFELCAVVKQVTGDLVGTDEENEAMMCGSDWNTRVLELSYSLRVRASSTEAQRWTVLPK